MARSINLEKFVPSKELLATIKNMPRLPGVYVMKNEDEQIIYIGKAKNLKDRVKTYFTTGDGRAQVEFLIRKVKTIENIVTGTEEQAFILERDLINRHKPKYNIRLKDDKSYLSIRLDENAEWPKLELVRKVQQDSARYYGPYTFTYELRGLLEIINKTIPLRTCSDSVLYNRQRPCLEYQIKRCAAPCCLAVDKKQYGEWVKQAKAILEGKTSNVVKELEEKMERFSEMLEFEKAAECRDKISLLKGFSKAQEFISPGVEDRDVFGFYREGSQVTLCLMQVRYGRIKDTKNYKFEDVYIGNQGLLATIIEQHYKPGIEFPAEIISAEEPENIDFLSEHLKKLAGHGIDFLNPQKGIKFRLLKLAELNAEQNFKSTFEQSDRNLKAAEKLALLANLKQIPRRIECFDISNLQGSDIVGANVSFYDGLPDKNNYRRYKISQQGKPDDFAAMNEVIERRLQRCIEEDSFPDLIIIDGGAGQLSSALQAKEKLKVNIDIIGLAKERTINADQKLVKPERIYLPNQEKPIELDLQSDVSHFVARIRDEVHRFVISFHRAKRSKRVMFSVLDEVSGLGPERKRRLLKHFGSVENIKHALIDDLARVGRMPISLAEKLIKKLK